MVQFRVITLPLHGEELNSMDIPQRLHALLALQEKMSYALQNINKRQHIVKKYFDKRAKLTTSATNEKVLLWDSAHVDKGKHSKFQKLWFAPCIIASIVGNNSYLLKDTDEQFFCYTTNGSHLKHYVEPSLFYYFHLHGFLYIFSLYNICFLIFYFCFPLLLFCF
jgi:hypothetical protein